MFAPKIAKAQTKASDSPTRKLAPQPSSLVARPLGGGAVEQARMLQGTIGNQAMLRLLAQRTSNLTKNRPGGGPEQEAGPANLTSRGATPGISWDFSKIPAFPLDRANRPQTPPLLANVPGTIQPKLVVGQVNDPLEHEADHIADHVMRMPAPVADPALSAVPPLSRKCVACEEEVEPRFGYDFEHVRVHTDAKAIDSARALDASAYTIGRSVVFGAGRYAPDTTGGRRLLAHELTHVIQQSLTSPQGNGFAGKQHPGLRTGEIRLQRQKTDDQRTVDQPVRQEDRVPMPAPSPAPLAPAPAPAPATTCNVTLPAVRSASTPAEMRRDRIPPRVETLVDVRITGWDPRMPKVTLYVDGMGFDTGEVLINGAHHVDLAASEILKLTGQIQTKPHYADQLRLVAKQGPTQLASSAPFSVSAIPQNFSISLDQVIWGLNDPNDPKEKRAGVMTRLQWESDSNDNKDLNEVGWTENVETWGIGIWANVKTSVQGDYRISAINLSYPDAHSDRLKTLTGVGIYVAEQTFSFDDARSSSIGIPVTNSGFRITRIATTIVPHVTLLYTVDIHGAASSANGVTSAAGSGSVTVSLPIAQ
jgi:hypothetical protein